MKSKVMNRPMFLDVENVGIMQGFKDDDYEDMNEGYESAAVLDRTPSSPEILMNNLRGDMRSVDARIEELAQLVGEDVAMETPPEVLALLQPVLAAQEGIASLPAGMPPQPMGTPPSPPSPMGAAMPAPDMGAMMPPGAMPPEAMMMPPEPPPTAQEPLQMAEGGLVQRFRDGSDEEGVTPADDDMDPSSARAMLMNMRSQNLPSLQQEFETMLPTYQQALGGGDRSMTQAQILFDIAQAGLNLAAGTDSRGQRVPAGASFASSLAAAAQGLPERIAERAGQMQQQEVGTRLAALRGAESSLAAKIKAMEGESPFGKGSWDFRTVVELTDRFRAGALSPEMERRYIAAAIKLMRPTTESYFNDQGYRVTKTNPGMNLPFVTQALQERGMLDLITSGAGAEAGVGSTTTTPSDVVSVPKISPIGEVAVEVDNRIDMAGAQTVDERGIVYAESLGRPDAVSKKGAVGAWQVLPTTLTDPGFGVVPARDNSPEEINRVGREYYNALKTKYNDDPVLAAVAYNWGPNNADKWLEQGADYGKLPNETKQYLQRFMGYQAQKLSDALGSTEDTGGGLPTIWDAHEKATGLANQLKALFGERIPFNLAGDLARPQLQAVSDIDKLAPQFAKAFRETKKLAEAERAEINRYLNLGPKYLQNTSAYTNNLISLTLVLDRLNREAMTLATRKEVTKDEANLQNDKAFEIQSLQRLLGAPPVIRTPQDFQTTYANLPNGAKYIVRSKAEDAWVVVTKGKE